MFQCLLKAKEQRVPALNSYLVCTYIFLFICLQVVFHHVNGLALFSLS